jgi:hypothetical protein
MKPLYLIIVAVLLAAIVGAGGFYSGMVYAQSQAQSQVAAFQQQRAAGQAPNGQAPQGAPGGAGQFRGGQNSQLGAPVANGQIKSVNGDTVEISTADSVVTVKVNDATVINKTDRGTISDLQVGDRVTVFSKDTGTSPTASGIQIQAAQPAPTPQP